jgi:hypothetical protein
MGGSEKKAASLQVLQGVHSGILRFAQNDTRLADRVARTSVSEVRGSHLAVLHARDGRARAADRKSGGLRYPYFTVEHHMGPRPDYYSS